MNPPTPSPGYADLIRGTLREEESKIQKTLVFCAVLSGLIARHGAGSKGRKQIKIAQWYADEWEKSSHD